MMVYRSNHEQNVPSQLSPHSFHTTYALGHKMYGYALLLKIMVQSYFVLNNDNAKLLTKFF